MSQSAVKRLYLMQVGSMPEYQIPLVCYLVQTVLLTIDAVPFRAGFVHDLANDGSSPNAEAVRASTNKLLDLVEQEQVALVIFGHDSEQWAELKKLPAYYE